MFIAHRLLLHPQKRSCYKSLRVCRAAVPIHNKPPTAVLRFLSSMALPCEKTVPVPRPSSSVILVSPTNQILLLHRVKTSSAFPSAHVFPGGNVSAQHDGVVPPPADPARHEDSDVYRLAAIRETFEESGIVLATDSHGELLKVSAEEREHARREVHAGRIKFGEWLESVGGKPDLDRLLPFTRWITPKGVPKRFTTQMYIYFLPIVATTSSSDATVMDSDSTIPTPDGGVEHTTARYLPANKWLSLARQNRIILFPPQFFLLYLLSPMLSPSITSADQSPLAPEILLEQRSHVLDFLKTPRRSPSWADVCISPVNMKQLSGKNRPDGRSVLDLKYAGDEVSVANGHTGKQRSGVEEWVVLSNFTREGPRDVEIVGRGEISKDEQKPRL